MNSLNNLIKAFVIPLVFLLISSCGKDKTPEQPTIPSPPPVSDADLKSLPKDVGGVQTAVYLNNSLIYGYYVYTPSGYATNQASYPLLIFLHGGGESGNSMINSNVLNLLLAHGPPELISKKHWSPTYPMIVVSPQETWKRFGADSLQNFIKYIIGKYRINTHRIYITGLSMGGISTYDYLSKYAKTGYAAAAVPMSIRFDINNYPNVSNLENFPIWTFCGGADLGLPANIKIVDSINHFNPSLKAKITIFPGVGHDCWDPVYSGSGMGTESKSYDAFNMSIYDWMFQYKK